MSESDSDPVELNEIPSSKKTAADACLEDDRSGVCFKKKLSLVRQHCHCSIEHEKFSSEHAN